MEKEIKITIEKDGKAEEIQTNCAIIVANEVEKDLVRCISFAQNCTSIDLAEVADGAFSAVDEIFKKRPEVKAIIEFSKVMKNINGNQEGNEEG